MKATDICECGHKRREHSGDDACFKCFINPPMDCAGFTAAYEVAEDDFSEFKPEELFGYSYGFEAGKAITNHVRAELWDEGYATCLGDFDIAARHEARSPNPYKETS